MSLRRVLAALFIVAASVFPNVVAAQLLVNSTSGTPAFGTYDGGPDVVNVGSLNVHWSIPLVHKAGRGMNFDYALTYDSSVWNQITGNDGPSTNYWSPSASWHGSGPGGSGSLLTYSSTVENNCQYRGNPAGMEYTKFVYVDSVGNSHAFMPDPTPGTPPPPSQSSWVYATDDCSTFTAHGFPAYATDGSGIQLRCDNCNQVNPTFANVPSALQYSIVLPSGQIIPNSVLTGTPNYSQNCNPNFQTNCDTGYAAIDSNGNYILYSSTADPYTSPTDIMSLYLGVSSAPGVPAFGTLSFTDTLGMQVMSATAQSTSSTTPAANVTVSALGSNYVVTEGAYTIGAPAGSPIAWGSDGLSPLVSGISLPDGRAYSFGYEAAAGGTSAVTGRLSSVTLPSGGSITYQYGSVDLADYTAMSLVRIVNDGKGNSAKWTYQRTWLSSTSQWQTLVTDPLGNQTVYLFTGPPSPAAPANLNVVNYSPLTYKYYEISRTVYSGPQTNNQVLLATTTQYTWSNTSASAVASKQVFVSPNGGPLTSSTLTVYNQYGLPSETDVYDYGTSPGQSGALLSKTATTYASDGDLLDRPASVISYDGQGKILSSATYGYDETAVVATSGMPNLVAPSSARGNLTSWSKGQSGASTTYLDTGEPNQITASSSGKTMMSYMCGGAYPSATSTSFYSTVTYSTQTVWNCTGGVPTSQTDINQNVTTTAYDSLWRPTSTTDALGNVTTLSYPTPTSNTGEMSETFNSGQSLSDVIATYDGLGRTILSQTRQAPGSTSFNSVSTTFDVRGMPSWSSVPYVAAAGAYKTSGSGTTSSYDALGRVTQTTDAGGGWLQYVYNGNDTRITAGPAAPSETTKARQLESNGAGQLTSVCEITSGPSSGACGQNTAQTGYFTKYSYDGGNLIGIAQNVQAGAAATQLHTFTYDSSGNEISELNPETGVTTYSYQPYGGPLSTATDNIGNVTTYTYDTLNRVLSSVVTGPYAPETPQTHYVYDAATMGTTAMQNALGGVAEAYTCTGACTTKLTDIYYSSLPETVGGVKTGRAISQMWESTPHSNGYVLTQSASYPNGSMGSVAASLNGNPIGIPNINYGLDPMGRPATVVDTTHSLNLVTGSAYNVVGGVTGVNYGNGDSDSLSFDPATFRQTGFGSSIAASTRINVAGTLTWNPNGSLNNFTYTDSSDATKNQNCGYQMDPLNRLASVNCAGSWAQNFTYDPFGNINKNGPASPTAGQITSTYAPIYSPQTNQAIGNSIAQYDLLGNQTVANGMQVSWNANAQPVVVNGQGAVYDAAGRLVEIGDAVTGTTASLSTGSIMVEGGEPAVPSKTLYTASATITINSFLASGLDQSKTISSPTGSQATGCGEIIGTPVNAPTSYTCYDSGGGEIMVMGFNSSGEFLQSLFPYGYGDQNASATELASTLAAAINQGGIGISATSKAVSASQAQVIVSISETSATPVNAYVVSATPPSQSSAFPNNSFTVSAPGNVPPTIVTTPALTDTGTLTATINGVPASYTWGPNDSLSSVWNGLINNINAKDGGFLHATQSPTATGTIVLTSLQKSSSTNWPVSLTISSSLGPQQSGFGGTALSMTGGVAGEAGATANGNYTTIVYTPGGAKLGTLQNGTLLAAEIPLPGGGTAMYNASGLNYFRHADWLGSSRLATTWNHSVYSKTAYAPFGETYNQAGTADISFTGQDVDTSSGAYNFLFRKLDPVAGRWLRPDPSGLAHADLTNPQSLNLYAYVLNNPLTSVDPNGLECVWDDGSYDAADDAQTADETACSLAGGNYIPPALFETSLLADGQWANIQYGSWSGQANSNIAASWLTSSPAYGDLSSAPNIVSEVGYWWLDNSSMENPGTMSLQTVYQNISNIGMVQYSMPSYDPSEPPSNGNRSPGFTQQDGVCSTGPLAGPMNAIHSVLACCQVHDACYSEYRCNASSFDPRGPSGPCKSVCNSNVEACLAKATARITLSWPLVF